VNARRLPLVGVGALVLVLALGLVPSNAALTASVRNSVNGTTVATDVAMNKTATQSSTFATPGGIAAHAVDGNVDGVYADNSVSHTNSEANAWWSVDLGSPASIQTIRVWNRSEGTNVARLTDFWVIVSTTPFTSPMAPATRITQPGVVWSFHDTGTAGFPSGYSPKVTGRYVMVQLNGTNFLHMAEVQVYTNGV
jgi:hypothetical protein